MITEIEFEREFIDLHPLQYDYAFGMMVNGCSTQQIRLVSYFHRIKYESIRGIYRAYTVYTLPVRSQTLVKLLIDLNS